MVFRPSIGCAFKTGESRILLAVSDDMDVLNNDAQVQTPLIIRRKGSRHCLTTKDKTGEVHYIKFSLECIPHGQGMHNTQLVQFSSIQYVARWAGAVDKIQTFLGWSQRARVTHGYSTYCGSIWMVKVSQTNCICSSREFYLMVR